MPAPIARRSFLRGTGALVPLPFLEMMARPSAARADEPAAAGPPVNEDGTPLRFVTLFKPNGVHPPSWNISGGTEHDFRMSPLMKPFEKHRDDVLLLDNMGDWGFSSHASSTRRFLSGHHENKRSASMDQLIADRVKGDTPHRSLELTTEGLFPNQIGCSYLSYDEKGAPIPRESDPQLIFDRLFRSPHADPRRRDELTSVLDRVRDDARSLQRRAGREDRATLEEYLEVVRTSEKRLANIRTAEPRHDLAAFERPASGGTLDDQVEAMLELIELALWTDQTRCVTYMLGNSNSRMIFDFLGIREQHHYLSHFFRNFSRSNLESLLRISLWHMEKFDSLLTRLKSRREGERSLLDNTLVLYGSGMGHSDNHTVTRIPVVLAGASDHLETGRYVRYAENQELGRLHLSLLSMFGIDLDSFARSKEPLPGLDGSHYEPYRERPFESWVRVEGNTITVQGRLRMSDDLDEARIFYVDVAGGKPVRVEVQFGDFHRFNLAYHCGTAVTLVGTGSTDGERRVIRKVTRIDSVHGRKPGTLNG